MSQPPPPGGRRNPWWIPPFLGRVPPLADGQVRVLGTLALALLFENYDQSILTAALKQIAQTFAVAESDLGEMMAWVHLGSIAAFLLIPVADRIGRRRLFLLSIIGLSLGTIASAFAQTVEQFIALQMVSRTFMVTCSATAFVIVTEEFPAEYRGWGIGVLAALGSFGYGLGLALFSAVEVVPYGWRALYVVGMVPLLLLPRLRRQVPETQRFERDRREREAVGPGEGALRGWLRPVASLARAYPARTAAVGLMGALSAAAHAAGFNFAAYHVQTVHAWSPGQYSLMAVLAGMVGIIGHPYAGRLADRRGRRAVGFAMLASFPLLSLAFYHGPGWLLPFVWVPMIFTLTGGSTITRALSTELIPTAFRGTSSGWLSLSEAIGRTAGLFAVGLGTPAGGSNVPMISWMGLACVAAAFVVLAVPETGRRELEEISRED